MSVQGDELTKIILTRHSHFEGIKPERFRGGAELPLTELGRAQAKAVAARIAKTWAPAKVYTSPMGPLRHNGTGNCQGLPRRKRTNRGT